MALGIVRLTMLMGDLLLWIVVIGGSILAIYLYFKFFKLLKIRSIMFVDGGLGTGKSFLSVALAVRLYKKQLRIYKIKRWLFSYLGMFSKKFQRAYETLEEPLLYSNIRLRNVNFVKLTKELLYRQTRFAYKSVVLIDEMSLMADQFCYKDREMSERLSLFFKLFRHETRGGYCVINSQSTSDLHYSLKYVLSDYLYIHHMKKYPFFAALKVQEMAYTGDSNGQTIVNVRNEDIEVTLKTMLVLKKYYKYYDSYCYSVFTDSCRVWSMVEFNPKGANIKDRHLISFKQYMFLQENLNPEKGKQNNENQA